MGEAAEPASGSSPERGSASESDEQSLLDQHLEDIEQTFRVAELTYNDPFGVFECGRRTVALQRSLLTDD